MMRSKWPYALMAAISGMLIVLVLIQVLWLRHAAAAEKRERNLRVEKALAKVSEQLRDGEYCVETFVKAYIDRGERFYMIRSNRDKTADTLDMLYDEQYSSDKHVGRMRYMGFRYPFSMEVKVSAFICIDDSAEYYNERRNFYEQRLAAPRLTDIIRNVRPIDSVFSMHDVDSLVRTALSSSGADTVFTFGFITTEDNRLAWAPAGADTAALKRSSFSVPLFNGNQFMRPHRLAILFPRVRNIYRLDTWLFVSMGIILLLIVSFYALVRLYLRQSQLSQMKSDFINNLTHEFNTPMANIALALETLESSGAIRDARTANIFNIIASESGRLRDNIERSLQVAMLDEGGLRLHKEEIDLVQLLNTVITSYQLQCAALGGTITFTHGPCPTIVADEPHILNCVVNLLDNAIKYRNGPPQIALRLEEKAGGLLLTVADNGIGMSAETQKHIFDKFYRAHEGNAHNTKGFGLGLSYVKGIVEAHAGTIEVWSVPGTGTRFTIRLPKTAEHDK